MLMVVVLGVRGGGLQRKSVVLTVEVSLVGQPTVCLQGEVSYKG